MIVFLVGHIQASPKYTSDLVGLSNALSNVKFQGKNLTKDQQAVYYERLNDERFYKIADSQDHLNANERIPSAVEMFVTRGGTKPNRHYIEYMLDSLAPLKSEEELQRRSRY